MNSKKVLAAYLGVILIWSTTLLAIKWSGEGPGYLAAVSSRMVIGIWCTCLILAVTGKSIPLHRRALLSYLAGFVQIYCSMLMTHWSAQHIPSGWISVVFGFSPLMTAFMASAWLGENSLSPGRILSMLIAVAGLGVMYGTAIQFSATAELGIMGILTAAFLQAASSVWIKRVNAGLPALAQVGGTLLLAVPAFLMTWYFVNGSWPPHFTGTSLAATAYLGIIATPIGFSLYFYVLRNLPATKVSLITLITPILALLLGHYANQEPLTPRIALGAGLILGALLLHEWSSQRSIRSKPAKRT